jgi:hypothetical protein
MSLRVVRFGSALSVNFDEQRQADLQFVRPLVNAKANIPGMSIPLQLRFQVFAVAQVTSFRLVMIVVLGTVLILVLLFLVYR